MDVRAKDNRVRSAEPLYSREDPDQPELLDATDIYFDVHLSELYGDWSESTIGN